MHTAITQKSIWEVNADMNKEEYSKLVIEVITFDNVDVITASGDVDGGDSELLNIVQG